VPTQPWSYRSMHPFRHRFLPSLFLAVLFNSSPHWAQDIPSSATTPPRINARAQWQPSQAVVQQIRMSCPNLSFPALGECFARGMQRAGASQQAVAFTTSIANEGYLHVFVPAGIVDVAFVTYPFRANDNEGCLLINGAPPNVDIDNLKNLPQAAMQRDAAYRALAASYPNISLFPGDRTDRRTVVAGTTPEGGQRFLAEYLLVNGCHACARIGSARFAFDFDANGKLLGIKFIELRPAKSN
jgi:hypothetical protein